MKSLSLNLDEFSVEPLSKKDTRKISGGVIWWAVGGAILVGMLIYRRAY